jgi:hypothetical protein
MTGLDKKTIDTLIILRYGIDRHVDAKAIETLKLGGYIEDKLGGGWIVTSAGRECVRRMKG